MGYKPGYYYFHSVIRFSGGLRKSDHIVTLWKMRSESVTDDILGFLAFKQVGDEVKVYGFRI